LGGTNLQLDNGYTNLLIYPASGSTNIIATTITPLADATYSLGSGGTRWDDIYAIDVGATNFWGYYSASFYEMFDLASATVIACHLHFRPVTDATYDLGDANYAWNVIYSLTVDCDFLNPLENGYITIGDECRPSADVTHDFGTSARQWLSVYTRRLFCSTEATARLRIPVGTNMYG
jgi:hypothetical protein